MMVLVKNHWECPTRGPAPPASNSLDPQIPPWLPWCPPFPLPPPPLPPAPALSVSRPPPASQKCLAPMASLCPGWGESLEKGGSQWEWELPCPIVPPPWVRKQERTRGNRQLREIHGFAGAVSRDGGLVLLERHRDVRGHPKGDWERWGQTGITHRAGIVSLWRDWDQDRHGGTGMTVLGSEAPTLGLGSPQGGAGISVLALGSLFWDRDRCSGMQLSHLDNPLVHPCLPGIPAVLGLGRGRPVSLHALLQRLPQVPRCPGRLWGGKNGKIPINPPFPPRSPSPGSSQS